jgi:tape measure domain-containing protein
MSDDIVIKLQADIRDLTGKVSQVTSSFSKLESTVRSSSAKINGSLKSISGAANLAKTAFAAIAFGNVTRSTVQLADAMTNMRSRIRLVTSSTEEAVRVQQRLMDVAARTRTDFAAVGALYARIGRSADELGLSQERLIGFTETFSQALKISGATTAESQSTILQLSQALASGRLQGAELNAVLEAGGRAAKALADGLGVPIGSLKKLGEQGELTAQRVIAAIESQAGVINTEFGGMALTVGDAMTVLQNAMAETIGKMNEQTGATATLSSKIVEFADTIKDPSFIAGLRGIADAIGVLANAMAGFVAMLGDAITLANTFGNDMQALAGTGKPSWLPETSEQKNSSAKRGVANKGLFGDILKASAPAPKVRLGGGGGTGSAASRDQREAEQAARQYAEAVEELNFQIEQLGRSQEHAAYIEDLRNNLARAGVVIDSERGEQIAFLTAQVHDLAAAQEAAAEAEAAAAEAGARWQDMKDAAGEAVASAFERAILEGEELSDVFKGLAQDLARMIFQKMVFDQIAGAVSGGIGSILSGGKALGGAVHAGSAYKVGESGPEVFVPRVPGSIVPRSKMGGGGVTINSTVNAAPGTNRAELQAMLNQRDAELIKRIPRVMVDKQRRNALSGAF